MALVGAEERHVWTTVVAHVMGGAASGMDGAPSDEEIVEVVAVAAKIGDAVIAEFKKRDTSKP